MCVWQVVVAAHAVKHTVWAVVLVRLLLHDLDALCLPVTFPPALAVAQRQRLDLCAFLHAYQCAAAGDVKHSWNASWAVVDAIGWEVAVGCCSGLDLVTAQRQGVLLWSAGCMRYCSNFFANTNMPGVLRMTM